MARAHKASEWITWRSRDRLTELGLPGVYFIGQYPTAPSSLKVESPSIIYIGHTILPLKHRLLKFHYSAFDAKDGHYGGSTFNEIFFNGQPGPVPAMPPIPAIRLVLGLTSANDPNQTSTS